jgi:hypothetical protein
MDYIVYGLRMHSQGFHQQGGLIALAHGTSVFHTDCDDGMLSDIYTYVPVSGSYAPV